MIVLTVGEQEPFDRLVGSADVWAGVRGRRDIFAQVGATQRPPLNMEWVDHLDPPDHRRLLFEADVIVSHAGMGTILTALELGKPILVMPRRSDLKETRSDHQIDTARAFAEAGRVAVAWTEDELLEALDRLDRIPAPKRIASHASLQLLAAVRRFIREDSPLPDTGPTAGSAPTGSIRPHVGRKAA